MKSFVYFERSYDGSVIRVGYTGDEVGQRHAVHETNGFKLLAQIPATGTNERSLHNHFAPFRIAYGSSQSCYDAVAVEPYVNGLMERFYASNDLKNVAVLPRLPWAVWSPKAILKPLHHNGQYLLFRTEGKKTDERDTWQTPKEIADICREALGGTIDLDPASCAEANERIGATYFHTEKSNGLAHDWNGKVFLNPPYGGDQEAGADKFTKKLLGELESGRVTEAITVLNLQSVPTLWFPAIAKKASCHAIWKRRIPFLGPAPKSGVGTKYGASKNGTIFSYFGRNQATFARVFRHKSYVFEVSL